MVNASFKIHFEFIFPDKNQFFQSETVQVFALNPRATPMATRI
jgi:hypothetical protein